MWLFKELTIPIFKELTIPIFKELTIPNHLRINQFQPKLIYPLNDLRV